MKMRPMLSATLAAAAALLLPAFSSTGRADISFGTGLLAGAQGINLVDTPKAGATPVDGNTQQLVNGHPVHVSFYDQASDLLDASHGLASISAHGKKATLQNLTMKFDKGFGATGVDFSIHPVQQPPSNAVATITAWDQIGHVTTSSPFSVGSGENKFTVTAINGELITKVEWQTFTKSGETLTPDSLIDTAKQYSVLNVSPTPEPSTFALAGLGGLGLIGYGWRRRRRAGA
jgi:hypothetical protein